MASGLNYWDGKAGRAGWTVSPFNLTSCSCLINGKSEEKIWMWPYFSGIHLFSRKDSRIRWFFSSSFFLTDFLSLLHHKIDFYLQNVFMGMRAFQWKHDKSSTNIGCLWEKWGHFYNAHFSQRATPPAILLYFQFHIPLVCLKLGYANSSWACAGFLNLRGLRRRSSDSWLTQKWLRKPGWIRSPDSHETPIFAECWLVTNETIFQSDFTSTGSLTPPCICERGRGGKIKSTWQKQKLRTWMFLWLNFRPKQVSGRARKKPNSFSTGLGETKPWGNVP